MLHDMQLPVCFTPAGNRCTYTPNASPDRPRASPPSPPTPLRPPTDNCMHDFEIARAPHQRMHTYIRACMQMLHTLDTALPACICRTRAPHHCLIIIDCSLKPLLLLQLFGCLVGWLFKEHGAWRVTHDTQVHEYMNTWHMST